MVLGNNIECPLDCKEIKPVYPKANQSWKIDAEAETPVLWLPDMKSRLIRKDPDAGKDWRLEKGSTEDEMVGWHHWLSGYEFEHSLGAGEGWGSLACCSTWGRKESVNWLSEFGWVNNNKQRLIIQIGITDGMLS